MKGNALFILLLLLVGDVTQALAQAPEIDVVTLKDGTILKGKLLSYSQGKSVILKKEDGETVEIADAEVAKIQQGVVLGSDAAQPDRNRKVKEQPKTKTLGVYANSMLSFATGESDYEGLSLGAGFSQVFGYQTSRWLGMGAGFGVDNYSRRGETVYPLFVEIRSFLPSKNRPGNFYAMAGGGYSVAFSRKSLEITAAKGGPMTQLAIGYRSATEEGIDIFVDLGAKFQKAYFERTLHNGDVEVRNIVFKRIAIRVGIGLWKS